MHSLNTQFEHELRKSIDKRMLEIAEVLSAGTPKDYAEYLKWVGRFQELKHISESVLSEINTTINTR